MFQCFNVSMFQCFNVSMFHCFTVSLFHCFTVSLFHCFTFIFNCCTVWISSLVVMVLLLSVTRSPFCLLLFFIVLIFQFCFLFFHCFRCFQFFYCFLVDQRVCDVSCFRDLGHTIAFQVAASWSYRLIPRVGVACSHIRRDNLLLSSWPECMGGGCIDCIQR